MYMQRKLKVCLIYFCVIHAKVVFPQLAPIYEVPLTEFGRPDLQGVWTDQTMTPLERPVSLGLKSQYTLSEINELEGARQVAAEKARQPLPVDRRPPPSGGMITQQSDVNFNGLVSKFVPVFGEYLTSRIVQPEDGRLPYLEENPQDIFALREKLSLIHI